MAGNNQDPGPQPSRRDKRLYLVLMAVCITASDSFGAPCLHFGT